MKNRLLTNEQSQILEKVKQLIQDGVFTDDQKHIVLAAVFNQELSCEIPIDLNDIQSKWIEFLSFKYLTSVRGDKKTPLFKLVMSSANNIGRYFKSFDDLIPRGMFDFSPIENY